MKTIIAAISVAALAATAFGLTIEQPLTSTYVKEHAKEFSVKAKKENGLVAFTIVRTLSEPKYLVAHLEVRHVGKVVATSDTPVFGKARDNTFYFSIAAEDVAGSTFKLSEHGLGSVKGEKKDDIPVVGGIVYQVQLCDFIPVDGQESKTDK